VFALLLHIILQGSDYEQKRVECKWLYELENQFEPKSQKSTIPETDVDISIRRMLDPQTAAEFFAAIDMEPKSWLEKIIDWIQETDIWKRVLFVASEVVYWIRGTNGLKWIFQSELSALYASLIGKRWHFVYMQMSTDWSRTRFSKVVFTSDHLYDICSD